MPSRQSTSYRDAIPRVSSNSVQNRVRNPADKVSTDGQTDGRKDLNTIVHRLLRLEREREKERERERERKDSFSEQTWRT